MTLTALAELVGGIVEGDGTGNITGVCSLDNPKPGHITLAENPKKIAWPENMDRPGALIVNKPVDIEGIPLLITENPRVVFTQALRHFYWTDEFTVGIDQSAVIAEDAAIDATACIGPNVVIERGVSIGARTRIGAGCYIGEGSVIGEDCLLYPNVSILSDVRIGKRCIFHSGAVIGSDGFGYTPTAEGNLKVPQVGGVEIGDDVEIGANTTIDRATLDMTVIENDVKIDNLVQIAHNVRIGERTRIAAQVGIPGRVTVEKDVVIAGQAGLQNGITVGEGSVIAGRAGVTKSIPKKSTVSGYPAEDHRKALHLLALQRRLPDMIERLEKLEKAIESKSD